MVGIGRSCVTGSGQWAIMEGDSEKLLIVLFSSLCFPAISGGEMGPFRWCSRESEDLTSLYVELL